MGSLYFHAGMWPALDCCPDRAGSGSCCASLSPSLFSLELQWDMPEVSHHLWGYSCMCCPKVQLKEFCPKGLHLDWQGSQNQWINNVLFLHLGEKLGVTCQKAPQMIPGDRAHLLELLLTWQHPLASPTAPSISLLLVPCSSSSKQTTCPEDVVSVFAFRRTQAKAQIACCSLHLCLTLWNPIDGSPPGSSVHRIL